jgi:CheY-like chemotaxis protein
MAKILVVEDETFVGEMLEEILYLEGYNVARVGNGLDAIQSMQQHIPDLILCDIIMPEMDGYDLLRYARETPEMAGIPFVFLTGLSDRETVSRIRSLGAVDYLYKPFMVEELVEAVSAAITRAV